MKSAFKVLCVVTCENGIIIYFIALDNDELLECMVRFQLKTNFNCLKLHTRSPQLFKLNITSITSRKFLRLSVLAALFHARNNSKGTNCTVRCFLQIYSHLVYVRGERTLK